MFSSITNFCGKGRENHSIVFKLEGTLLLSANSFPYFMLVALEAGSPFRALLLLLSSPILWLLNNVYLETMALHIMIFITLVGLRVDDVKAVAKSVLPRFYLEDIRASVYKVFTSCRGKKYIVTSIPRIMVEAFLREYLGVDCVISPELRTFWGCYCLGLVASPLGLEGVHQFEVLKATLGDRKRIDVGIANAGGTDNPFMLLCQEGYIVPIEEKASCLPRKYYPKPLIFHDGRLVARPTPLDCLAVFLWFPMGIFLAISRLLIGKLFPYTWGLMVAAATGMRIRAKLSLQHRTCKTHAPYSHGTSKICDPVTYGALVPCETNVHGGRGPKNETSNTLYVCSHRTLMDPVIVASVLQRHVTAVTYSVSSISELLSPIRTVRLSRDRCKDGKRMLELLKEGDLVVCPEGTTCREPYLLRFSPLFAEIADIIVPVAVLAKGPMFHGTTVRGHKWLDSFFFLMNPNPYYYVEFLEKIPGLRTCERIRKSSYDIANEAQQMIGHTLGFECTNLTRRDKYRMLAGNDCVDWTKLN